MINISNQFDSAVFKEIFKIDNIDFTAGLININRKVNVLDKYAERTIDDYLKRDIIGVYYNYSLTFLPNISIKSATIRYIFGIKNVSNCRKNYIY